MLLTRPFRSGWILALVLPLLAACAAPGVGPDGRPQVRPQSEIGYPEYEPGAEGSADQPLSARDAARNFVAVVRVMEPQIEAECRARTVGRNCDFQIGYGMMGGASPNAAQSLGPNGEPIIEFNLALIAEARNRDELAFVMGHEAAHHIAGHLPRQQNQALTGAMILGALTAATGADDATVREAQNWGATVASRAYSKEYELEADQLGAILSWNAGFDPERGALFFTRLPDPGDTFLGSHPANAQRIAVVRRTVDALKRQAAVSGMPPRPYPVN